MRRASRAAIIAIALVLAAGAAIHFARRGEQSNGIIGVVRATEVRVEPEVTGQLVSIAVEKGAHVRAGDVLAKLSAVELTAQVDQARAELASATANRNNVYAGVRHEQVDSLKAAISKASARLDYVQLQLTRTSTLASQNFESQQGWTRPQTTLPAHAPMWRRPRRITTRPSRTRRARNARSPTRRCRPQPLQSR